jgi:hypothetical protein
LCRGHKMNDSENDPTPHLTAKLLAALSRPGRFFVAVPSAASAEVWFVVESANPREPLAPAHSSEAEAWRVAEEMNEREINSAHRRFATCSARTSTAREIYRLQSQRLR